MGTRGEEGTVVIIRGSGTLEEHGPCEAGGVIRDARSRLGSPFVEARVWLAVEAKGAAVEESEVVLSGTLDGDLV